MRIAQVSPLYESVPPSKYGGTERIIYYLTEELLKRHHHVTVFASGDSQTSAELISPCAFSLRSLNKRIDPLIYHFIMLDMVIKNQYRFDIIHFHTEFMHFLISNQIQIPHLTTLHGRLDLDDYIYLFQNFNEPNLVAISEDQRTPLPEVNWIATIHHGLPKQNFQFRDSAEKEDYLVFLGRISPEKGPEMAINLALKSNMKLKIGAKVDPHDEKYFQEKILPLIDHPLIEFLGEINEFEKNNLLGKAKALLFPVCWPEPFGLVMVESLACGTPVIAFKYGSVPEIILKNRSGFIVNTEEEALEAIKNLDKIKPIYCRTEFEQKFLVEIMTSKYIDLYQKIISSNLINKNIGILHD